MYAPTCKRYKSQPIYHLTSPDVISKCTRGLITLTTYQHQVCGGEPRDPVLACAAAADAGSAEEQGGRPQHRGAAARGDLQGAGRRQEHHQE